MPRAAATSSSTARPAPESRRGQQPDAEAYLARVGDRVRMQRARRGMSRRVLAEASGVSERYLAELERGAGNASLLVLRQIAVALGIRITDLVSDLPDPPIDLALAVHQLEGLDAGELQEARTWLTHRFGRAFEPERRIALIGLRGAGKTTLGRRLAEGLGIPFIELDREIERASGADLAEIFATQGQAGYRRLEHDALEAVVKAHDRAVIATGGSLVTEPATLELLLSTCHVIWLKARPDEHMGRVAAQGDLRPMAQSRQAMDDLKAILESREPLYAKAHATLDTSGLPPDTAAAELHAIAARLLG